MPTLTDDPVGLVDRSVLRRWPPVGQHSGVEQYPDVPSKVGPRPVWLMFLATASEWRRLLADRDWDALIEEERQPFGLFIACPAASEEEAAWADFADYCVQRELRLAVSWGPDARMLEDLFDDAYLMRHVDGLPTAEPLTASGDGGPLEDEFDVFLADRGDDLRRLDEDARPSDWVRVALVVGEQAWLHRLRAAAAE